MCHTIIIEFVKNASSFYVSVVTPISHKVSLATIGVCVFCAFTSVGALFYFAEINKVCIAFLGAVFINYPQNENERMILVKNLKKVIAVVLCLITVFSVMSISASAASVSASLGYNEAEDSGDYAYWNGSKVVKSSSTTKDEIKWMQAALNRCISKEGLSATKLTIDGSFGPASKNATIAFQKAVGLSADGSFGPATIKKMKSILNDNKDNSLKPKQNTTTTASSNNSTASSTSSKTLSVDMNIIKKTGYQPESGPCGCYALAYCRDIIDGKYHSWTEYSNEGYVKSLGRYGYTVNWSKGSFTSKTGATNLDVLKALYNSINNGKPAVVRVKGNGSTGHYVAVVGYKDVTDVDSLSEKNFLIIDSASKTAFNRGITSMTSGSTGYTIHSNRQYVIAK